MRYFLTTVFSFLLISVFAFRGGDRPKPNSKSKIKSYIQNCAQATAESELNINNVRAKLLVGGDMWWDGSSAGYIVPKPLPGEPEVSSIFAGAVWMGGFDPAGNLKVAAQDYGTGNGSSDYWPGPLDASGATLFESCTNWDRIFSVTGEEIDLHIAQFRQAQVGNIPYDIALMPKGVLEWPGQANPFFADAVGFELPFASQGLAPYWDENGDGLYTPQFGDYPIIEIRGCSLPNYADQMEFWIFNDAGNVHTESGGDPLNMEIQAQAFAFESNDELNNMTFTRYKLINRAQESIQNTIFSIWVDVDLGCGEDDYIGCDTTRNLMYAYNSDAVDGSSGANCASGANTYGDKIPYLGVDFFRGPLAPKVLGSNGECINPSPNQPLDTLVELGMSSFIYFNQASATANSNMIDPTNAQEYYNYMAGTWRDGTPLTVGGTGLGGTETTNYAFFDEPNNPDGWSMCSENIPLEDVRTVQSSGPFRLDPGQINELIIGVPWVLNVIYPCPDMGRLFEADNMAQDLFNSCFDILIDGPDAPDVDWISQDQKLIGILSNDPVTSNNRNQGYSELDRLSPLSFPDDERLYKFEGYIVYQLRDQCVTREEVDNPEKARIVFQKDIENQASDIYNWIPEPNPNAGPFDPPDVFVPSLMVEGENEGIETTFQLNTDLFTGESLINDETYYYMAIAYAFNEYESFDPVNQAGQTTPYIEGRRNIQTYIVSPSAQEVCFEYGDQPIVTRLDGRGAGGQFLSISKEERNRLIEAQEGSLPSLYNGPIVYNRREAPIVVDVVDPLNVIDGKYVLRFDQSDALELGQSQWELFDADSNQSLGRADVNLENQNEQVFSDLGFSITIGQTEDAGDLINSKNGAIGQRISYADPSLTWLTPVPDNANDIEGLDNFDLHYQTTAPGEINSELDPFQAFTNLGTGHFAPYTLMDWNLREAVYATPAWQFVQSAIVQFRNPLEELNNVDIVFTNDKTKWSRCVVVETGNRFFTDAGFELDDGTSNFEVVKRPSVSKEDNDADGRPDPDGTGTTGLAWFPGYAIDVETGTRLNLFFGENSAFGDNTVGDSFLESVNGSDMMFNPSAQAAIETPAGNEQSPFDLVLGGMHYMYVTRQPYDECEFIKEKLEEPLTFRRIDALELITWAGIGLGSEIPMLSYSEGLVPTETVVSLRVDNPYDRILGTNDNETYPSYEFGIDKSITTSTVSISESTNELDKVSVYPNPVLASSNTGSNQMSDVVKIVNLPGQSVVTVFTQDGRFVKQFQVEGNPQSEQKFDLEWNLKNANGASVSGGVYLIHVQAEGIGQKVLKLISVK